MDWRSIEKDPPEMVRILTEYDFSKSDGLLLTDGKNVYAGTLLHYNGGYMFEGYDLGEVTDIDNFTIIRFECGENCQWMPMVSAQPERKSAGEMLRELGYRKISEKKLYTIYESKEGERICLKFPGGRYAMNLLVYATRAPGVARELDAKEILALARLIEEMEAKDAMDFAD